MTISFSKYHGTGNDFVLIDGRQLTEQPGEKRIAHLCHRYFGIGADGVIIVSPSQVPDVDYDMEYYNSDGRVGSMCGNGARCAFHFAQRLKLAGTKADFSAYDGIHTAEALEEGQFSVTMKDVDTVESRSEDIYILDTGSPHYVHFVSKIDSIDVRKQGRDIRFSPEFFDMGINVNFAQIIDDSIRVRTYERGVEEITLSCGTGVTAVVLAFARKKGLHEGPVRILTDGGNLSVNFLHKDGKFTKIKLVGPVVRVFDGVYTES